MHEQAESWYNAYDGAVSGRSNEFLNRIGRLLVTKLSLERRLVGLQTTGVIDFESQPPVVDLHAFHVSDKARRQLSDETTDAFGRAGPIPRAGRRSVCVYAKEIFRARTTDCPSR